MLGAKFSQVLAHTLLILPLYIPSERNPSCEQTAPASRWLLLQTVPQRPSIHTSTLPSLLVDPFNSLISPSAHTEVYCELINDGIELSYSPV